MKQASKQANREHPTPRRQARARWATGWWSGLGVLMLLAWTAGAARAAELSLRHLAIDLPGAPVSVIPADLDGDGRLDLVITVAYTEWNQIGIEETSEMDGIEGLVEVLTVVPALLDHREIHAYMAQPDGSYTPLGEPMPLPPSVLSLEPGPPGIPVLALTDEGASRLHLAIAADELGGGTAQGAAQEAVQGAANQRRTLALDPILEEPPVLAGTGAFLPALRLVQDLDGDGIADLLLPTRDGYSLYLATAGGLSEAPASHIELPFDEREFNRAAMRRHYPLPEVRDVDGDGLADLLLRWNQGGWERFYVLRNEGGGRFAAAVEPLAERWKQRLARPVAEADDGKKEDLPQVVFFGDLDGDGRAEYLTVEAQPIDEDASMRQEMADAKRPRFTYRWHRQDAGFRMAPSAQRRFTVEGYAFGQRGENGLGLPGGVQDLNGDGRLDLVTLTLEFSLLKMMTVIATKRLTLGLDFHVWCQQPDGDFRQVPGLDLSGKFRINLNDLRIGRLSQFAGDFDGDGRADFVQAGRGKQVTIHRGRADCSYPTSPDLTVELEEEPRDLALLKVLDLDGDGRSDLSVVNLRPAPEPGVTPPVRLDLYLSGGAR